METFCLKFGMLLYPDHPELCVDFGYGLLISFGAILINSNESKSSWVFMANA